MAREAHPLLAALAEAGEWAPPVPERPTPSQNGTGGVSLPPASSDPQAASYAAMALDKECDRVAGAVEGTRNDTLNTAGFRMGQLAARGWLHDQVAESRLIDAAVACGLAYAEAGRTVRSGLDAGLAHPREGVELYEAPEAPPPAFTLDAPTTNGHPTPLPPTVDAGPLAAGAAVVSEPAPERARQLVNGGEFIYGAGREVPALWGDGDEVLWARGEPLLLTGPTGVGKTTLGTMLVAGRLGLLPDVLELPIEPGKGRTLVWAMDRPAQIQRAMARLLRAWPQELLDDRLIVWQGPPPMDMGRHPHVLFSVAEQVGADTVVIDSLKDAAVKLSDEETGQGLARAMNMCVSNGVEVLAYHHQLKRSASPTAKPNTISDVYGSTWITAGAGSVILLWGNPGDLVVQLSHLKQPAGEVGPLTIGHDHIAGRSFLFEGGSDKEKLIDLLRSGPQTVPALATWLLGPEAGRAGTEKIRRRLEYLVRAGMAVRLDETRRIGSQPGVERGGSEGLRYALASSQMVISVDARETHESGVRRTVSDVSAGQVTHAPKSAGDDARRRTARTADDVSAGRLTHGLTHATHAGFTHAPPPPFKGGGAVSARAPESHDMTSDGIELSPGDERVCSQCHRPASRFIPGPRGRSLCPTCAYPTEPPEEEED